MQETIERPPPDEEACLSILRRYETPPHIISHSRTVWAVAGLIGDALNDKGFSLDMDLLRAACLLHDIAKYPCILAKSGRHDEEGERMLQSEGLPSVGRIIVQHVILKGDGDQPLDEAHLLNYSDKRVVHDKIATLDERFTYLAQTYGKTPKALEFLEAMKQRTAELERRIFRHLDFTPSDVARLVEKSRRSHATRTIQREGPL